MALFSALLAGGSALGSIIGGRQAARAAERASADQLAFQREALEYQQMIDELPLELRNEFLPMLADFYRGGEGQQQYIDDVRASPFYQSQLQQGEEAILRQAGATGGLRSGNAQQALAMNSQNLLQNMVNQQLQGQASLSGLPLNTQGISNTLQNMGATSAAGTIGAAQARQAGYGNALRYGMGGLNNYFNSPGGI